MDSMDSLAMTGIPASIGGAIRMNAGGLYGCISDYTLNSNLFIKRRGISDV